MFEDKLAEIEKRFSMPGTIFQRALVDNEICRKYGIKPTGREATLCWCVGIGKFHERLRYGYGLTMEEALDDAIKMLEG